MYLVSEKHQSHLSRNVAQSYRLKKVSLYEEVEKGEGSLSPYM